MHVDVESVLASAARTALNPALWPETMWRAGQLVGSDFTVFDHVQKATGQITLGFCDRPDHAAEVREKYERYFHRINPRFVVARAKPLHAIIDDDMVGDDRALGRSEFYVDFLKPSGLQYFIGSGVADDAEQTIVFSHQRSADRGRVTEQQRRDFIAILPAIRNAMAICQRMVDAQPHGAALAATLDRLSDPMAIIRADGALLFANRTMRGLLARGDVLRARRGAIEGASPPIQRALASVLRDAGDGRSLCRSVTMGATGPLILRLASLSPHQAAGLGTSPECCFCLILDDPTRPAWPQIEEAMTLFDLTRREATVGTHLAAGLGIDDIARRLGLSRNTVRSHLAMLRDKLGARTALGVAARMRCAVSPLFRSPSEG